MNLPVVGFTWFIPCDKCSPNAHTPCGTQFRVSTCYDEVDNSHQESSDGSEEWESGTVIAQCSVQNTKGRKCRVGLSETDARFIET